MAPGGWLKLATEPADLPSVGRGQRMARLVACRICANDVASTARICPHCGGAPRVQVSGGGIGSIKVSGGFAAFIVMCMMMGTCVVCVGGSGSGGGSSRTTSEPASEPARPRPVSAPASPARATVADDDTLRLLHLTVIAWYDGCVELGKGKGMSP